MATLKDIAKGAGVTVTTVSRVLNNRGYISDETRNKVYRVMKELNYQPNEIARSLARKKSNIIGLIIPTVAHSFFSELSFYLEYYAYNNGYKVLLCNSQLEQKKEKEYIDMLRAHQVDGIIMASHTLEVDEYLSLNLPVVTVDRKVDEIPNVSSDNYYGGSLATNLLIDKGCNKIAYIGGSLKLNLLANKRYEAFINTAKGRNVDFLNVETDINGFKIEEYEEMINNLFQKHPDIDGIFASSDLIAASIIKVCNRINKKVPDDVKIVGYDDVKVASLFVPQITTIRQPIEDMGKLVIELLAKLIDEKDVINDNILPVKLIERETT
ncbi:MAG: LacI family transcriptional regulator [Firmicutes bacterium]|nr:LacI family transcriptional regulator [Bacillota bacterium]